MKSFLFALLLLSSASSFGQYYYKDIIGTKETSGQMKTYKAQGVSRVVLNSFDQNNVRNDQFYVEQQFIPATQTLRTLTRTDDMDPSVLVSFLDANGNVIQTIDSSEAVISTTFYRYDGNGKLITVESTTVDSSGRSSLSEKHIWEYNGAQVSRMLRIKNQRDTVFVSFKTDSKGNISEEQEVHKGIASEPVYYYYDDAGRLTDIVRYNTKAKRLLPEYMFEYSATNQVIQKITVPSNSDNYLIWRYQFDNKGLKTKEVIYDKHKQVTGKIEYQYVFGS
ncbi:MAG TPA: hypothetical protein VHK91_16150 [Flavisolibacter sp.]|jgi:hypothetical protein|nr:hypothetical protein [Flavisolibacter sp.]